MNAHTQNDDRTAQLSGSDDEGVFEDDMETLRRACLLTGSNPSDIKFPDSRRSESDGGESDDVDDLDLFQRIRQKFSTSDLDQPLSLKPLSFIAPGGSSDEEDNLETLRAIQRRFAAYDCDTSESSINNCSQSQIPDQVRASTIASEKRSSNILSGNVTNGCEGFPDFDDCNETIQNLELSTEICTRIHSSGCLEWRRGDAPKSLVSPNFPASARIFFDAIKKNRSCQKFLRDKLIQIEARIEENKKLKERVKILKDFQVSCRIRTGRALSQKKDPRVQLISTPKMYYKKSSPKCIGPAENSFVAQYRMTLTKYPLQLCRKRWSKAENENLRKGLTHEFQKLLLEKSVDWCSDSRGSFGDQNDIDSIIASIRDHEVTPEELRLFLPKVDWERFASSYVEGRSGAECESRWLNWEDPLINHTAWTQTEDKHLLFTVQQLGVTNWIDIATSLKTNRTPFQCLARYQRSLNASIMKREWTEEDDAELCAAIEVHGDHDWQLLASYLIGRTGSQCSNRWKKTLHPTRQRKGRWTVDEDRRLEVAVMLFGPKTWNKIAQFVPGRTQVQCRERWVNSLDPSLKWDKWTEEEDLKLEEAIQKHGYCWSKIAACVSHRTDNQCLRRWKVLHASEVPLLQAAKRIQKVALVSNFVDRESERPALSANDFLPLPTAELALVPERKRTRGSRKKADPKEGDSLASCNASKENRSKRPRKKVQSREELQEGGNGPSPKRRKLSSRKKKVTTQREENLPNCSDPSPPMLTNGEGVTTKPRSKRSRHAKAAAAASGQNLLLPPPPCSESRAIDNALLPNSDPESALLLVTCEQGECGILEK